MHPLSPLACPGRLLPASLPRSPDSGKASPWSHEFLLLRDQRTFRGYQWQSLATTSNLRQTIWIVILAYRKKSQDQTSYRSSTSEAEQNQLTFFWPVLMVSGVTHPSTASPLDKPLGNKVSRPESLIIKHLHSHIYDTRTHLEYDNMRSFDATTSRKSP